MRNLIVNQFTAWNSLIVGAANRSEAAARETTGAKDRLDRMERALGEIKDRVDVILSRNEDSEFIYTYLSLDEVDAVDCNQGAAALATDIESEIYYEDDPDLKRQFKDKEYRKKRDWMLKCVLHRRDASAGQIRRDTQPFIISRLNDYARKRRSGRMKMKTNKGPNNTRPLTVKKEPMPKKTVKVELQEENGNEEEDEDND
ncbi:hypothetical protein PENTCL1PPCAC_1313 [Pristionchus entomophagus]|uniref:Uncharacterized protein n=1 Tax=Pristionchus entomophagus TaxID=358040 RepID=A0AAV5SER2_9BILA|nr:hypothetical protein PENTCL1PPCAC_1313 [Pristionchus entomophagus]